MGGGGGGGGGGEEGGPIKFAIIGVLPFLNKHKDLDLSKKTDLDIWDCFGMKKKIRFIAKEIR